MNNSSLKILDWDSDFFKLRIAKVLDSAKEVSDFLPIFRKLEKEKIDLAYFASDQKVMNADKLIFERFEMFLVDEKVTFLKNIVNDSEAHPNICEYKENEVAPELLNLAIESGIYSRFKIDQNIPNAKFEEMYRLWVINSVRKKISDVVLVYKKANKIIGFVTVGRKEDMGKIGIIAVDAAGRGKGVGKALIKSAENYCFQVGIKYLKIVTQGKNIPACKFYKKCGYTLKSTLYFYHIWKSKN